MLLELKDATISYGEVTVLNHASFLAKGTEKLAIVGENGCGKSTLLKVLAGELSLDRDDRRIGPGLTYSSAMTVGLLSQDFSLYEGRILDDFLSNDPGVNRFLTRLGLPLSIRFRDFSSLSGGEKTKVLLSQLLYEHPQVLLLDEPTNHLDVKTLEWLEEQVISYDGCVIVVSHDRYFLDQVVSKVWELERGVLTSYVGNYSDYRLQKLKNYEKQKEAYERQQEEKKRLEELIRQFKNKSRKAAFARSRKSILNRMVLVEKPVEDNRHLFVEPIVPNHHGPKWVVQMEQALLPYGIRQEISLKLKQGTKLAILGDNGIGKSTLLKVLAGLEQLKKGRMVLGEGVFYGYYDQFSSEISSKDTVLEYFSKKFPQYKTEENRKILANYLFFGKDCAKAVDDLSGGQKSRLCLAILLEERPNLLLLDEPTNHMDIPAKETLESAFAAYSGTMVFVSHDRYFVKQVADAILTLEGDEVFYYPFGYDQYLRHRKNLADAKKAGVDLGTFLTAKEQALVADLKAVPKAERHERHPLSTEEAYVDWSLRDAKEALEEAMEDVALWLSLEYEGVSCMEVDGLHLCMDEEYQARMQMLTNRALEWYDQYVSVVSEE